MARWPAALGTVAATLAAAGCGPGATPLADGCTSGPAPVLHALRAAPRAVALSDGTLLSRCIADGLDDAELQNVGIVFHQAAEGLRERAQSGDRAAALQLGYLIGATRRGAARTNGVSAELVRRVELVGGRMGDAVDAAARADLRRGMAAGERGG